MATKRKVAKAAAPEEKPYLEIDILGIACKVLPFDEEVPNPDNRFGQASIGAMEIRFHTKQSEEQLKNTLLHEVTHHLDYALQLGLSEKQVHRLATTFIQNMRANEAFYKWLMASC